MITVSIDTVPNIREMYSADGSLKSHMANEHDGRVESFDSMAPLPQ